MRLGRSFKDAWWRRQCAVYGYRNFEENVRRKQWYQNKCKTAFNTRVNFFFPIHCNKLLCNLFQALREAFDLLFRLWCDRQQEQQPYLLCSIICDKIYFCVRLPLLCTVKQLFVIIIFIIILTFNENGQKHFTLKLLNIQKKTKVGR